MVCWKMLRKNAPIAKMKNTKAFVLAYDLAWSLRAWVEAVPKLTRVENMLAMKMEKIGKMVPFSIAISIPQKNRHDLSEA